MTRSRLSKFYSAVVRSQQKNPYFLVACIATLITCRSIHPGYLILGGDEQLPELNPLISIAHRWPLFDVSAGLGKDGSLWRPILFPITAFDFLLSSCKMPPIVANYFWIILIEIVQSVALVRLFRTIFPEGNSLLVALYCGIFAIVNPYNLINFHTPFPTTALAIASFPGLIAALLKCSQRPTAPVLLEFCLYLALNVSATFNLAIAVIQALAVTVAALILIVRVRRYAVPIGSLLVLFLSAYGIWLPAEFRFTTERLGQLVSTTATYSEDTLRVTSQYSRLENSVRLVGEYLFFNRSGHNLYLPDGPLYVSNVWLIAVTLIAPGLALMAMIIARRSERPKVWSIALLTATALFVAKGASWPGGLFLWLFEHVPVFHAFRDPFNKFEWLVVIGYGLLSSRSLTWLGTLTVVPQYGRRAAVCLAIVLISAAGYPILVGHFFFDKVYVKIPNRYFALAQWLNEEPDDFRLLELPVATNLFATYRWGYVGAGLLHNLLSRPVVARLHDFGSPGTAALDDMAQSFRTGIGPSALAPILGLYGVGYVVNDPAIDPAFFAPLYADSLDAPSKGMTRVRRFADISLYGIKRSLLNPLGFAAQRLLITDSSLPTISEQCLVLRSCRGSAVVDSRTASTLTSLPFQVLSRAPSGSIVHRALDPHETTFRQRTKPNEAYLVDFADTSRLYYAGDSGPYSIGLRGLTLAGKEPVLLRIGDPARSQRPGRDSGVFHTILETKPKMICAPQHGVAEYRFSLPLLPLSGNVALLAFKYRSAIAEPSVQISASTDARLTRVPLFYYYSPLSFTGNGTFSRLFYVPPSARRAYVQVFVSSGSRASCGFIDKILVSVAPRGGSFHLRGSDETLHATPPYFAAGADIATSIADSVAVRHVGTYTAEKPFAYSTDTDAGWTSTSAPVEYLQRPFATTGSIFSDTGHKGALRLHVLGGTADSHAFIGHLVPGMTYLISFTLLRPIRAPFRVSVLQETGNAALTSRRVAPGETDVSIRCTVPLDTSSLRLYLYFNEERAYDSVVVVARPTVTLLPYTAGPVRVGTVRSISAPRSVSLAPLGADKFSLSAKKAPKRWLFVFNTSYDPDWEIEGLPQGVTARHVTANVFVNGWLIESETGGDQEFRLVYKARQQWLQDVVRSLVAGMIAMVCFSVQLVLLRRTG